MRRNVVRLLLVALGLSLSFVCFSNAASAQPPEPPVPPTPPTVPSDPGDEASVADPDDDTVDVNLGLPDTADRDQTVKIILTLTVLSVAPSLIVLMTSFTRIVIVLSLARNALSLPAVPPNMVIVGLAMFMTFFVMGPVISQINSEALQPYLNDEMSATEAIEVGEVPLKRWMLANTRNEELALFVDASGERPATPMDTPLTTVVPAFVLSELKTAFVIGFVIFIPFVIVDLVVAAVLMSLGMMMLPPSFVSLPIKIVLLVLTDGWVLIASTLLSSFRGG